MYCVRFICRDHGPNEEYFYNQQNDAEQHLKLFHDNDSDLYCQIELLLTGGALEIPLMMLHF